MMSAEKLPKIYFSENGEDTVVVAEPQFELPGGGVNIRI